MVFLKNEWKTLLIIVWLILITVFLFQLNGQLSAVGSQNARLLSTIDSVESVAIGTDANIADISKKVDSINSNVEFVVSKVRRR